MGITERPGACLKAELLGLQQAGELHSPQDSITSQRCCLCRHRPVPEGALPCCTLSGRAPPGSTGTPPGEKPRQEPRCCLANSLPLQSAERVSPQGSPPAELQVDSHLMPILLPQSALHMGSAAPTQIPQGPRGSGRGGWGEKKDKERNLLQHTWGAEGGRWSEEPSSQRKVYGGASFTVT